MVIVSPFCARALQHRLSPIRTAGLMTMKLHAGFPLPQSVGSRMLSISYPQHFRFQDSGLCKATPMSSLLVGIKKKKHSLHSWTWITTIIYVNCITFRNKEQKCLSSRNRGIRPATSVVFLLESFRMMMMMIIIIIIIITMTITSPCTYVDQMPPCGGWLASSFVFGRPNLRLKSGRFLWVLSVSKKTVELYFKIDHYSYYTVCTYAF
jgi:hypothetical protein